MSKEAEQQEIDEEEKDQKNVKAHRMERGGDGISLSFFKKNCAFLAGCLP